MSDPGLTDLREWDWPSLEASARLQAEAAEGVLAQAEEFGGRLVGDFPGTKRELRQVIAHSAAQRDEMRRLARLAAACGRHADHIPAILDALESGREVVVVQSRASEMVRPRSVMPARRGSSGAVRRILDGIARPATPRREAH